MHMWIWVFFLMAILCPLLLKAPPFVWRTVLLSPFVLGLGSTITSVSSGVSGQNSFSNFFASLVLGVGLCVCIYSWKYFGHHDHQRFFPLFLAFTGAMLGVLWSDHLLLIYTFWEITSICSYALIAFHNTDKTALRAARHSLFVTSAGGLCLLAAFLLLGHNAGTFSLSQLLLVSSSIKNLDDWVLVGLLLGCMTKSAQFPFHFWLPGAMTAPIPVSCYLHSATMVNLGIFLLTRFSPLYTGHSLWTFSLCVVGGVTLLWGLIVSVTRSDIKQLLAWTTVSSLGGLFILVGLNFDYGWKALVVYLVSHALYKGSLFLCAGNLDKQFHTRELGAYAGSFRSMPGTTIALLLASGSMMGLPFSLGFLAKEALFKSAMDSFGATSLLAAVLVGGGALSFVVSYHLIRSVFASPTSQLADIQEVPFSLWLPPMLLAVLSWISGFIISNFSQSILNPIVSSIILKPVELSFHMWGGFNQVLLLSTLSFCLGIAIYGLGFPFLRDMGFPLTAASLFESLYNKFLVLCESTTDWLQNQKISFYLSMLLAAFFILFTFSAYRIFSPDWFSLNQPPSIPQAVSSILIVLGSIAVVVNVHKLYQVLSLSLVGAGVSFYFLLEGAIDVAITQVAIEAASVFLLTLSLRFFGSSQKSLPAHYQISRLLLAFVGFTVLFIYSGAVINSKIPSLISDYFSDASLPLAHGRNVVNVILVDFRGLDTLGEITVLGIAGMALILLLDNRLRAPYVLRESFFVQKAVQVLVPLLNTLSVFILFRGHHEPGGGFTGGLILSCSLGLYLVTFGDKAFRRYLLLPPRIWILVGLSTAFISGLVGPAFQLPPLSPKWWGPLGTPLLFDLGVYWLVLGATTGTLSAMRTRGI